jgi:hypothetical protein
MFCRRQEEVTILNSQPKAAARDKVAHPRFGALVVTGRSRPQRLGKIAMLIINWYAALERCGVDAWPGSHDSIVSTEGVVKC